MQIQGFCGHMPPLPFSDHKFQSYMYSDEFIESYMMMMREKCVNKEKLFNEYMGNVVLTVADLLLHDTCMTH